MQLKSSEAEGLDISHWEFCDSTSIQFQNVYTILSLTLRFNDSSNIGESNSLHQDKRTNVIKDRPGCIIKLSYFLSDHKVKKNLNSINWYHY